MSATTYELMPVTFSNIQSRMVTANVAYITYVLQPFFAPPMIVRFTFFAVKGNITLSSTHEISSMTSMSGVITSIHSPKSTPRLSPSTSLIYCSAMPLGGVPIGVARPPMLAPMGIARARAVVPLSVAGNCLIIGAMKVSIIAAVAVLLTNIENMAVTRMKPSNTMRGFEPKGLSIARAMLTSMPLFDATSARMKPPIKSITVGLAKHPIMDL